MPKRLILASASPRRKELLAVLKLPFEVIPSEVEEDWLLDRSDGSPTQLAEDLAREKAMDVFHQVSFGQLAPKRENRIIVAADTIVVSDRNGENEILGKPRDADDARRMLRLISGTSHSVLTGVCLMECEWLEEHREWWPIWNTRVVETQVRFRKMSPELIDAYIATGEPFDKAGAYGIQGYASAFVEAIHGDYFNVVGLPVSMVASMLENIGIQWWRGASALENNDAELPQ